MKLISQVCSLYASYFCTRDREQYSLQAPHITPQKSACMPIIEAPFLQWQLLDHKIAKYAWCMTQHVN